MKVLELIAFLEKFPDTAVVHVEFPDMGAGGWTQTEELVATYSDENGDKFPVLVVGVC